MTANARREVVQALSSIGPMTTLELSRCVDHVGDRRFKWALIDLIADQRIHQAEDGKWHLKEEEQ